MGLFKKGKHAWDQFYPKGKRQVKVPNMSLYEYIYEANKDYQSNIAINYFGNKLTYKELFYKIDMCARAMRSNGIRPGDVVAVIMANTPEAVIAFYAISKIGAVANMIHPLSAEEELKESLIKTNSVMAVAINMTFEKIKNVISETNVYKVIIVSPKDSMPPITGIGYFLLEDRKVKLPRGSERFVLWKSFMSKGVKYNSKVLVKTTKDQAAAILHSGGTTGTPKNILLSNGNINVVAEQAKIALPEIDRSDVMLSVLPLFHCFGLVEGLHYPLGTGQTVVMIPRFDASRFDKLLTKYNPTIIPGVPTLFEAMIKNKHMDDVDLSNIKYIVSGGDTLNAERNKEVNNFLKAHGARHNIVQGYGMTETGGGCIFGALGSDELGSCGIPLPSNEIKIIDIETKEELPAGETGEILISGPSVMMGYLNDELETNKILEKDKRGKIWVHTGDMGYVTERGILYFVQRLKRLIIVSGYNVYPSHLEDVISKHPYVLDCCVVGIPHPYKVQVPKAYITLKDGYKDKATVRMEIKNYCKKNLAKYMLPKEFEFRESLPKTMIGKVDYRKLEDENKKEN